MPFQLEGITPTGQSIPSFDATGYEAVVSPDGTTVLMFGTNNDMIGSYTLTTPHDLTTKVAKSGSFNVGALNTTTMGMRVSTDGLHLYLIGWTAYTIYQIDLVAPYELTGSVFGGSLYYYSFLPIAAFTFDLSEDGTMLFLAEANATTPAVYRVPLVTPWAISSATAINQVTDPYQIDLPLAGSIVSLSMINAGSRMLVLSNTDNSFTEYALSEAYNPSTAIYTGIIYDASALLGTNVRGASVSASGYLYAWGPVNDFYQFLLATLVYVAPPEIAAGAYLQAEYFRLTLTGAADLLSDVVLPMSSLTARLRSGSPSYLQATVPYTDTFAAAIADRPNGDLLLQHIALDSYGVEGVTAVVTVAFETVQLSKGTENKSINLTGHRQSTNIAPVTHSPPLLSIQNGTNATTAIAPGYAPLIHPADTLSVEGVVYVIGTVSIQASITAGNINTQTQYIED